MHAWAARDGRRTSLPYPMGMSTTVRVVPASPAAMPTGVLCNGDAVTIWAAPGWALAVGPGAAVTWEAATPDQPATVWRLLDDDRRGTASPFGTPFAPQQAIVLASNARADLRVVLDDKDDSWYLDAEPAGAVGTRQPLTVFFRQGSGSG
jgi:hypothetical protein